MSSSQSVPYVDNPSDDGAHDAPSANMNALPTAAPPKSRYLRLTSASMFGSIAAIFFFVVAYILHSVARRDYYYYMPFPYVMTITPLILSFFNRLFIRRSGTAPLILNFVFDLVLSIGLAILFISNIFILIRSVQNPCYYLRDREYTVCLAISITSSVTQGLGLLGVGIAWISHVIMFVMRSKEVWRMECWKRPFPWFLGGPNEQLAFEFSIRLGKARREPDGEVGRSDVDGRNQIVRLEDGTRNETETLVEV